MGVRSPDSPCNSCIKYTDNTCPFFDLANLPECNKWNKFAAKTQEEIKTKLQKKYMLRRTTKS